MSFSKSLIAIISLNLFILPVFAGVKIKDIPVLTPYEICSQKNEDGKNLSIKQARADYLNIVKEALKTRKDAIDYAVTISDENEQSKLKEIAYSEYKEAQSSAQDEYQSLRKLALKKFEIDQRKCRTRTNAD